MIQFQKAAMLTQCATLAGLCDRRVVMVGLGFLFQLASMRQRRVDFYLAAVKDMLLAVGGRNENGALSSAEVYRPEKDAWSYIAGLPRQVSGLGNG